MRLQTQFTMLMLLVMVSPMAIDLYLAMMPDIQQELGISISQAQMTINIYVLTIGVAQVFIGPIADQYGRKPVAIIGLLTFCLASTLIAYTNDYRIILIMRFLQGVGACSATTVAFSSARDQFKPSELIKVMSYLSASITTIPSLAPMLGGVLAYFWDWRACFVFMAAYTGLLLFSFIVKFEETCPSIGLHKKLYSLSWYQPMLENKSFRLYAFISMMCMTNILVYVNYVPAWLMVNLEQPAAIFIAIFSLNAFCSMLACLCTPLLTKKLGTMPLIKYSFLFQVLIGVAMALTQMLFPHHVIIFEFLALCFAISFAWTMSPVISLALMPFKMAAGTAQALFGLVQCGGAFVIICILQYLPWLPIHVLSFMLTLQGLLAFILLSMQHINVAATSDTKKIPTV